jgi:hypothetical protein
VLGEMTDEFESKHGFPPGTNQIRLADHGDQEAVRVLGSDTRASADLVTFYGSIGEVSWEDVGNGYFVHPPRDVLEHFAIYGAVGLGDHQEPRGLVIGSDGGGLFYVVGPEGSVHRTRAATLDDAELDSGGRSAPLPGAVGAVLGPVRRHGRAWVSLVSGQACSPCAAAGHNPLSEMRVRRPPRTARTP